MTAPPQPEDIVLDASIVYELSGISRKLAPDIADMRPILLEYKTQLENLCHYVYSNSYAHILNFSIILIDGIDQLINNNKNLSEKECDFLQKYPDILSEYLSTSENRVSDNHLLQLFKDPDWIRPITTDEEQVLLASFDSETDSNISFEEVELEDVINISNDDQAEDINASNDMDSIFTIDSAEDDPINKTDMPVGSNTINPNTISPNNIHRELIDLVSAELAEIIDNSLSLEKTLNTDHEQQPYRSLLANMADQAENIGNAASLIGLEGLGQCSMLFSGNINLYAQTGNKLTSSQEDMLKQWPVKLLNYLQDINDTSTSDDLITLLKNESWIEQLSIEDGEQLRNLLVNPVLIDEEREVRQDTASADDVDLTLPDDVNQELLDGLLQDLPAQTEEFSTAIQNIYENGNIDAIDTAQRIAHTLKGAANVVGVKGVANLTHHLEDILQAQLKANTPPVKPLAEVLIRAADCLESMTEALLGIDSPPDDAVSVLQAVLDWANKLDNESHSDNYPDVSEPPPPTYNQDMVEEESVAQTAVPEDILTTEAAAPKENLLRVPAILADELLRLAGETQISTSQIQEHITNIAKKQEALEIHNQSLQQLSFDLEHIVDTQGLTAGVNTTNANALFDPLELDEFHEVHTISRKLIEIAADSIGLAQELDKDLSELKELVIDQTQLHKESEQLVLRTRMVQTKTIVPRLKRGVRQANRLTGKQVELVVTDNNTYMDSEVLNNMIEPLMHILRNAVDHGIEDPETRIEKNKSPDGVINLSFERKGNLIEINIKDDGQGLDTDKLYMKALNTGLVDPDQDLSIENIQRLILEPGFSTRSKVTQTSGRGIGLDVVSVKIRELKGSIEIQSKLDQGCRFILSIPISSFSTHSLLVRVRQYIYAISSHGIEKVLYPGSGELHDTGDVTTYQIGSKNYNVTLLETLLDLPVDRRNVERNNRPVILVKDEAGATSAILVQEVIDSRDVVVKSMGHYIPKIKGIIGATVLGNGSVAPVIDIPELLHERIMNQQSGDEDIHANDDVISTRRLPYVLVVDDSLSARRSLAQFIEDMGFVVRTARDGMEAVNIIESNKPDLLLVDMEMPKMNGLELTSHVRSSPEIKDIPVIMITSRSTDKHKKAAMERGVNHYMIKPFDEDELARLINNILEIA